METRKMNRLGIDMPLLGMGLMRLPMKDGDIDDEQAIKMVDEMYAAGVRYFDTAYVYGDGQSENFARRALTERYPRDSFCIATKLPMYKAADPEAAEKLFAESCRRLGVDYVDFYLLHALNGGSWDKAKERGIDVYQKQLKEAGRIRYRGFSYHGSPDDLRRIIADDPDWDFIQLQVNYYDWYASDAAELYDIVTSNGIPLIIMEPVRGSALHDLGEDVREMFLAARPDDSNVKWAMRWIGSRTGVNVVLSGVSTLEHVRENVTFYAPLEPLTDSEEQVVKGVVDLVQSRPFIACTGCRYCDGCPQSVAIPAIFRAMNDHTSLYDTGKALWLYFEDIGEEHNAAKCIGCGACVAKCPQGINIPEELSRVHTVLTELREKQKA